MLDILAHILFIPKLMSTLSFKLMELRSSIRVKLEVHLLQELCQMDGMISCLIGIKLMGDMESGYNGQDHPLLRGS